MTDVTKLNVLHVVALAPELKGWDRHYPTGSTMWIVKNLNGKYLKPYAVEVVASTAVTGRGNNQAYLVQVHTTVEDYFDSVSSQFDIVGVSEEDVLSTVTNLIGMHNQLSKSFKKLFTKRSV